jgi:glyoxylase-like metal-dependent hydrolase (beta-lactamase superfamily II)
MLEFRRFLPGTGGDCILITGEEKTALWDTGMFYCADEAIRLTRELLSGRDLDLIILSHTHYDHIGALSELRSAFPGAKVISSEYGAYVLGREGARKVMKDLSEVAAMLYMEDPSCMKPFDASGFYADLTVKTGDTIDLGGGSLHVFNTPGHTKCCISLWEPDTRTLICSESSGVYNGNEYSHLPALTSIRDCLACIDLMDSLGAARLFIPHSGELTELSPKDYFALMRRSGQYFMDMALDCLISKHMSDEETLQYLLVNIHDRYIDDGQPAEAFMLNTTAYLKSLRAEFPQYFEGE